MSILILHRGSLASNPYDRWLADQDQPLILLAAQEQLDDLGEALPTSGYAHVEAIANYDEPEPQRSRARELIRRYGVSQIVGTHERDQDRAAALRAEFGLPGQQLDTVVPYRDKAVMKQYAEAAGIPVAPHATVAGPSELAAFVEQHGLPVVVKPRWGASSMGLHIVSTEAELAALRGELDRTGYEDLLVEAFVTGDMYHVDGLVIDGKVVTIWPSMYQYSLSSFATDTGPRLDVMLDDADPLTHRLIDFGQRVLDAFPSHEHFAFHIEVFRTPDDQLVLCEAACRAGGAGIREVHRAAFGIEPAEGALRAQLGLSVPTLGESRQPAAFAGQLLRMKIPGTVRRTPAGPPPYDWVVSHRIALQPGQRLAPPTFSGDFMASFVVQAADRSQLEQRLAQLNTWLDDTLEIIPEAESDRYPSRT